VAILFSARAAVGLIKANLAHRKNIHSGLNGLITPHFDAIWAKEFGFVNCIFNVWLIRENQEMFLKIRRNILHCSFILICGWQAEYSEDLVVGHIRLLNKKQPFSTFLISPLLDFHGQQWHCYFPDWWWNSWWNIPSINNIEMPIGDYALINKNTQKLILRGITKI
jgi:hypothetical protein